MTDMQSSKRSKRELTLLLLPSALVVLAILTGIGKAALSKVAKPAKPEALDATNVGVVTIRKQAYSEAIEMPGRVMADNSLIVSSEIVGRIAAWEVPEGGRVEAGKPIVRLDVEALDARLAELTAAQTSAEANATAQAESVKVAKLGVEIAARDVQSAENNLKMAKGDRDVAKAELMRTDTLFKQGVRTEGDMDRAKNDALRADAMVANAENARLVAVGRVAAAEAGVVQAEASLSAAKARAAELEAGVKSVHVQVDKSTIVAPISGVLDDHVREVGEVVNPGDPMGHVYDFRHVRVAVDVADRYLPFLNDDNLVVKEYVARNFAGAVQKLEASLRIHGLPKLGSAKENGMDMPATIARISQAADPLSNTFRIELRAPNPAGIFKEGQLVKAAIKMLEYPEAILIPMTALRVTDQGQRCMVAVAADGGYLAVSRTIVVRSVKGDQALVTGDLKVGDLVVSSNVQELLEGEDIAIVAKDGEPFDGKNSSDTDE